MRKEYLITPVPKPRMTGRDRWLKPPRPAVARYRSFCTECMFKKISLPMSGAHITFVLPMPKGWSKGKKIMVNGACHDGTPDLDNLIKALLDALFENDSDVWDLHATKRWGREGKIIIEVKNDQ